MSELASYNFNRLRESIAGLFEARATHDLPSSLHVPPREWAVPYRALAEEVGLDSDLSVGHRRAAAFLGPVLVAQSGLVRWDPEMLQWRQT